MSEPAYFATGSNNRDDEKTMLNELVPTEACRNSSSAGTSLFWSSVVRYSRILFRKALDRIGPHLVNVSQSGSNERSSGKRKQGDGANSPSLKICS
jgi:hypothetical protein